MTKICQFVLETELGDIPLVCDEAAAPRTVAALHRSMPMEAQLHTPKIAGSHIYWHAPFVCDVEGSSHVMDMPAGAFFYWPERQFLEISFAPLQAETATVTPLGRAECPVELVAALGERVRLTQGRVINTVRLTPIGEALAGVEETAASPLAALRSAMWARMPDEVAALPSRRGIMHPIGPMIYAEADARNLHELLWWSREALQREDAAVVRSGAALAVDKAATRLRNFCHLDESATALDAIACALRDKGAPVGPVIDDAILIVGRLSAWLDLMIRWNDLNEAITAEPVAG
ncbi:hypothetical protein [Rhodoligotrophos defluvii]|uniref:hypothetical protein n=1 Tax=Rhodoligotrophos defluvii TaxID=2561934 RepID=UPI0010C9738A|nr:hypothetical protein [Rhodoligotrophos defluvii]